MPVHVRPYLNYYFRVCGKNIQRVKIETEGKIIEQVLSNLKYLGSLISNEEKDIIIIIGSRALRWPWPSSEASAS
jgi:hypothetical protein